MPMNEITKKKVNVLMDKVADKLSYLYNRWLDEREYEDFADYVTEMRKVFDAEIEPVPMKNAFFVKGQKRPFGFTFDFEGWQVKMGVTATQVQWSAKKLKLKQTDKKS